MSLLSLPVFYTVLYTGSHRFATRNSKPPTLLPLLLMWHDPLLFLSPLTNVWAPHVSLQQSPCSEGSGGAHAESQPRRTPRGRGGAPTWDRRELACVEWQHQQGSRNSPPGWPTWSAPNVWGHGRPTARVSVVSSTSVKPRSWLSFRTRVAQLHIHGCGRVDAAPAGERRWWGLHTNSDPEHSRIKRAVTVQLAP
jgi:hypothetical protein